MSDVELKACPFCGGAAEQKNYIVEAVVNCTSCDASICRVHARDVDTGIDASASAWNSRPPNAQTAGHQAVALEVPFGAIINGAAFGDRLERDYQFDCPGGPLVNCSDYVEFRRCFDYLAQWASNLPLICTVTRTEGK